MTRSSSRAPQKSRIPIDRSPPQQLAAFDVSNALDTRTAQPLPASRRIRVDGESSTSASFPNIVGAVLDEAADRDQLAELLKVSYRVLVPKAVAETLDGATR